MSKNHQIHKLPIGLKDVKGFLEVEVKLTKATIPKKSHIGKCKLN